MGEKIINYGENIDISQISSQIHKLKKKYNTSEVLLEMNTSTNIYIYPDEDVFTQKKQCQLNDDIDLNTILIKYYNTKIGKYSTVTKIKINNIYENVDKIIN